MGEFAFTEAKTAFNAIQFLNNLVAKTGQNNRAAVDAIKGHVIVGATFEEANGGASGRVTYSGPESGRRDFQNEIIGVAKSSGEIKVEFKE